MIVHALFYLNMIVAFVVFFHARAEKSFPIGCWGQVGPMKADGSYSTSL